ncbi:MAG: PTS system mannose/fructose/sorbose family transporter subunit IID [Smithella sp.]
MKKKVLLKIFLRSFFIHAALNFRRMQNLGFAMALIPLIREWNLARPEAEKFLTRHLQMFNTHPYLSAAIIGSVVNMEEAQDKGSSSSEDTVTIKKILAGPYAAIGDAFFWSALRPFAAILSCVLAYLGYVIAPLAFLIIYTPVHIWVRMTSFFGSYQKGKQGVEFIRSLNLPLIAIRIRWLSLILLIGLTSFLLSSKEYLQVHILSDIGMKIMAVTVVTVFILLIRKRISQVYILYGTVIILFLLSLKEF